MEVKEKRILEEVEKLEGDILNFAARLVAQPSTRENEKSALWVMENELAKLYLDPVRVPIDPEVLKDHPGFAPVPWSYEGRYNVVAVREASGTGGKSALFNGHLDVVSPEPISRWDRHPFDPTIEDGWMYGRGAGDMKAGVAAMTYAFHAVEKAGFGFNAPVTLEAVIEEECTGNGALACVAAGYDADAVLIPEPLGEAIYTAQIGVLWFKVTLSGVPSHVLSTASGVNAIEKCYTVISALRKLEEELNEEPHPAYTEMKHPLNLNIGILRGGDWPSTVPAFAEFHARLSYFPGMTYNTIRDRVVQTIEQCAENDPWLKKNPPVIEFYGFRSEGHHVKKDRPAFNTLSSCHKSIHGVDAGEVVSTATTDLRAFHFFGKGGDYTCYGPIAENIHASNERVQIESVMNSAKVYALFLARWCGLAE